MALMADGQLLLSYASAGILRLTADGKVYQFAGNGATYYGGDGGPATNAGISACYNLCAGMNGLVVLSQGAYYVVRWINGEGTIYRLSGNYSAGFSGDGGHPARAQEDLPYGVCFAPDGAIYIADNGNKRVRKIVPPMPGMSPAEMTYAALLETYRVASEDGSLIYAFNDKGRHIRTVDALTGQTLLTFSYTNNMLLAIIDGDDNPTTFERPSAGSLPTASWPGPWTRLAGPILLPAMPLGG